MKVEVTPQIYNNQEHPDGCIRIVATPKAGEPAKLVTFVVKGESYELSASEVIEAVKRTSSKVL